MKKVLIGIFFLILLPTELFSSEVKVIKSDDLKIGEYEIVRNLKPKPTDPDDYGDPILIQVKKNGKVLESYWGMAMKSYPDWTDDQSREWNKIQVGKLFPGPDTQLVLSWWGGGANGGGDYLFLNLGKEMTVLFSGRDFGQLGAGYFELEDINGDGNVEIIDLSDPWKHLLGAFGSCVVPKLIFAYDLKIRKYVPANDKFPKFFDQELEKLKGDKCQDGILDDACKVATLYWYQGRMKEGWDKFYGIFKGDEADQIVNKLKDVDGGVYEVIKNKLKTDPYISALKNKK